MKGQIDQLDLAYRTSLAKKALKFKNGALEITPAQYMKRREELVKQLNAL